MRRGFTLIEVMIVVLLAGIVAGAVSLSLAGPRRRAGMEDAVDGLAHFDRLTREYARRHGGSVRLVFDLDEGIVLRLVADDAGEGQSPRYVLPACFQIRRLVLAGRTITGGRTALWCSDLGYTPTYAVCIEGPAAERRWVLLAGLTGQVCELDDEEQVRQVMAALPGRRADAG